MNICGLADSSGLPKYGPNSFWPTLMIPEGLTIATGASVGAAVGAGIAVADPPDDGTAVGAAGTAVGEVDAGTGVAVADEPQANMAASSKASGPRIMILGLCNQWFKTD